MASEGVTATNVPQSEGEFRDFILRLDKRLAEIGHARTQLSWSQIHHETVDAHEQERLDQASEDVYSTPNHEVIKTWKGRVADPYLRRWANVLDRSFTMNIFEQEPALRDIVNHISERYLQWRPSIDGKEITYTTQTTILRTEPNREQRRKAYNAFQELGDELRDETRQMFEIRNDAARELGFPTYADMKLALVDDIDRWWLTHQFEEMERATELTASAFLHERADRAGLSEVEPWDTQYLFDQDCWVDPQFYPIDRLQTNLFSAMASLGLDSEHLGIHVDWYDSQAGGQCMTLGPHDIHILLSKDDGMVHYNTAFHEYGHAVHSAYNNQPYTLRNESRLFSEGMAMTMERWLHYPTWLRRSGVPESEVQRAREVWKIHRMYRHRRLAAMVMAELAVWDDPGQDFDHLFGETTERYLFTQYHPRPFAAVARWTRPVGLQSYFIADLVASQTHHYLQDHFAPLFDAPDAIAHIREHYWKPGNSIPWQEKIRNCTGKDLSIVDLEDDMMSPYSYL